MLRRVNTVASSSESAVTRIIRFLGFDGLVHWGEEPPPGEDQATVLQGDPFHGGLHRTAQRERIERLLAPVEPASIFCIGLNYMKHYNESAKKRGIPLPAKPVIFMKPNNSLNHPGADVWMPSLELGEQLDWEVELAAVIGKECRNVGREEALDYVLGYTVSNDITSRHWQKNAGASQWIKGKSFDTFAPLGPVLVTRAEIPDPQTLRLMTRVNGVVQQDDNTNDMIFTVAECIEWLSDNMTLAPGTVIMTGTPAGVATGRNPPNWLKVGDTVECEISGIGVLRNTVVQAPASSARL